MGKFKHRGIIDPISLVVISCFIIGGFLMYKTKEIDSPLEEAVEAVLETQGVDIDFSKQKKTKNN